MPLALITGAARANSIAAGIAPRLVADGWDVATSDLADVDCSTSTAASPPASDRAQDVIRRVTSMAQVV
jgi:3-oxoacyl-[acyl-carrier protein] reductase